VGSSSSAPNYGGAVEIKKKPGTRRRMLLSTWFLLTKKGGKRWSECRGKEDEKEGEVPLASKVDRAQPARFYKLGSLDFFVDRMGGGGLKTNKETGVLWGGRKRKREAREGGAIRVWEGKSRPHLQAEGENQKLPFPRPDLWDKNVPVSVQLEKIRDSFLIDLSPFRRKFFFGLSC